MQVILVFTILSALAVYIASGIYNESEENIDENTYSPVYTEDIIYQIMENFTAYFASLDDIKNINVLQMVKGMVTGMIDPRQSLTSVVGGFEKISVTGALEISADEVRVADLSADRIQIDAPQIELLRRAPSPLELADGSTVVDDGLDIVANEIVFSSSPTLVGAGPAPTLVLGSGGLTIQGILSVYDIRI